ncbi:MAG: VanZ family protein [Clostridiales bacterium]|nr:VanZ family protein [Clostridiales bacterium]
MYSVEIREEREDLGFSYYIVLIVMICIAGLAVLVAKTKNRQMVGWIFILYIIAILIITLVVRTYDLDAKTLLDPFSKYKWLWRKFHRIGTRTFSKGEGVITEILLNILLFVPMGFLVPTLKEKLRVWWKILLLGLGSSLFIELSQLVLRMGCFDVADLMHNTIGAIIGYFVWWKFLKHEKTAKKSR